MNDPIEVLGPGPFKQSVNKVCNADDTWFRVGTLQEAEALTAILNEAWSRHAMPGERKCGSCHRPSKRLRN